jgi:chaperone modulatory protein CbpM
VTEDDVCAVVERLRVDRLRVWVRHGWVRPIRRAEDVIFTEVDVARVRLVWHLERDLSVDEETIPIVLSLLDQVYGLRAALRDLGEAVDRQPEDVRRAIRTAVAETSARSRGLGRS